MRARIGITTFIDDTRPRGRYEALNESYIRSVAAAGGLPLLVPVLEDKAAIEDCIASLDGLLLSGGNDVLPLRYGEEPLTGLGLSCAARDESEIGLVLAARERGLPLLGICRGHQLINVALGGSLYQDLPRQLPGALDHSPPEGQMMDELRHTIELGDADSRLARALGSGKIAVNSFHHQGVKRLAPGLAATATAQDGLVEAFEGEGGAFLMGLQFHPEALTARYPAFLAVFRALVEAAEAYRRGSVTKLI
jgi:putative glutamine amidotransferase